MLCLSKAQELENIFRDRGYSIIGNPKLSNNKSKATVRCEIGYRYLLSTSEAIQSKRNLPFSPRNPYTITNIQTYTKQNVKGFKLLSRIYTKANAHNLTWRCPEDHQFESSWAAFMSGSRCTHCSFPNRQIDRDVFLSMIEGEYKLKGEYINASTPVNLLHLPCGYEFTISPCNFIDRQSGCRRCLGYYKTHGDFVKEVKSLVGEEYTVEAGYKGAHTHVDLIHNICGYRYSVSPTNFLTGKRCSICSGRLNQYDGGFERKVWLLVGEEYTVKEDYITSRTNLLIKHNTCGHIWDVRPSHFLAGSRCPKCSVKKSQGVIKIEDTLDSLKIKYSTEKVFDGCVYKGQLYIDFCIDKDIVIEFDGQQHFYPVDHWGGQAVLDDTTLRDEAKDKFCIDNNINLLRIPYWEFDNIEVIILDYLNILNKGDIDLYGNIARKYMVDYQWKREDYLSYSPKFIKKEIERQMNSTSTIK